MLKIVLRSPQLWSQPIRASRPDLGLARNSMRWPNRHERVAKKWCKFPERRHHPSETNTRGLLLSPWWRRICPGFVTVLHDVHVDVMAPSVAVRVEATGCILRSCAD